MFFNERNLILSLNFHIIILQQFQARIAIYNALCENFIRDQSVQSFFTELKVTMCCLRICDKFCTKKVHLELQQIFGFFRLRAFSFDKY